MENKYIKSFEVRWSDIDANRHLVHTAYSGFMAHTRLSYFQEHSITFKEFAEHQVGPVILNEHIHFISEVRPSETVYVDLELKGRSEDHRYYLFAQCLYKSTGQIAAYSEILIAYIDLKARKLVSLPEDWQLKLQHLPISDDFKILTNADVNFDHVPYHKKIDIP